MSERGGKGERTFLPHTPAMPIAWEGTPRTTDRGAIVLLVLVAARVGAVVHLHLRIRRETERNVMVRVGTVQGIAGARLCNAKHNAASPTTATCMSAARQRARPSNVHAERRGVVWVVYAGVVVVLARLALQLAECWRPDAMPILARAVRCEACRVCNGARGVRVRGSGTESSTVERHGGSVSAHLAEMGGRVSSVDSGGRHHSVHRKVYRHSHTQLFSRLDLYSKIILCAVSYARVPPRASL